MKPISMFEKPNPLPKYFGIDIDGTFYTTNEEAYKSNVEAFKMIKDKGVVPIFCTGRSIFSTRSVLGEYFLSRTGFTGYPGVYLNGTVVYDPDGNLIKVETFSPDYIDKAIKFFVANGIESKTSFFTHDEALCFVPLSDKSISYLAKNKIQIPELVSIDTLVAKNVVLIAFPQINLVIEGAKNGVDYNYKETDNNIACITTGDSTKKKGLEFLLKHLNTDGSNCAFIGDGENDTEAMDYCSPSFAVGNSSDSVKSHASWAVDLTYDQGAFHKVANYDFELVTEVNHLINTEKERSQLSPEGIKYCKISFAVGNARDGVKHKAQWVLDLNYNQRAFEKAAKLLFDDQEKNIDAFKLLKTKNITPFFCTGKGFDSNKKVITTDFVNQTGYNGYPGVYNSGAVVYDPDGNIIKMEKLSVELLDKFKDYATTNSINDKTIFFTDEKPYRVEELEDATKKFYKGFNLGDIEKITYDELKLKNVISTSTFGHNLDDFPSINDVHHIKFTDTGCNELFPKGVDKKTGLEALLQHLNSNGNECAYIGDSANDNQAMEYCYVSFAVGNAEQDTKKKAKWALDFNYDQGAFEKAVKLLVDDQE
ncbi:hypothetical protein MACJ_000858 [Theileria orientalis]|uniref:Hydrolase n=1 Tax=Theileria orientalis TaxID=68886 RepID=A0A976M4U3_THEOR|nr:hypothetical protein MACJ_000858 [Theileria orientalis]